MLILATSWCSFACSDDAPTDPADAGEIDGPADDFLARGMATGILDPVDLELTDRDIKETLTLTADGAFAFSRRIADGGLFEVAFPGPSGCVLLGATGTIVSADAQVELYCDGLARLSDLSISGLTAPALDFSPEQQHYPTPVSLLQRRTTVTAIAALAEATIEIAGSSAISGAPSAPLPLPFGHTEIEVVVSHPAGVSRIYTITLSRGDLSQFAYGKASNTDAGDEFGHAVAASPDAIAIGAHWEAGATTGVNGVETTNNVTYSGAVYIYH